jgi:hypothetical protein
MLRPSTILRRFLSFPTRPRTIVRRRPTRQRLRLELLENRVAPAVSLLNHTDSPWSGATPPDTCGAAGPNSYIETGNSYVNIYNKSTNATIASDNLNHFLFTVGGITPIGGLADATMAYDQPIGRFVVGDLDVNATDGSALDIAVSKSSNPTTLDGSSWTFYQINMSETNESADYPGNMGFNADAFVFTFNMFDLNDNGGHVEVAALSQASLAAGGNATGLRFDENNTFSRRPVTMHDSSPGGPMWFVTEGGGNNSIDLERIDNILTAPALSTFNIGVNSYNSINAPLNPDGSVITGKIDTRILKAAEANNEIVASQHVGVGSNEDDARWYQFDVSNINSPFLVQQGNVGFGANTYTVYPSIDINENGDIAMGFTKSGNDFSTDYMSTYITGRKSYEAAGTMEGSVEVKAGDSNYNGGREGDFSGINVDPNDGTFWVNDEYSGGGSSHQEIANFAINTQNFYVVGGQLQIIGDQLGSNYNDFITVDENGHGGVYATLNGEQVGFDPGQITSIVIFPGGGNNTVYINKTLAGVPVTIDGGSGNDSYYLAPSTDFLDNIQGTVTINGGSGTNTVTVEDQNDTFNGDTYTIATGSIQRTAEALISYSGVSSVTVNGGSANITYDINSTSGSTPLTINAGNGANIFVMTPASDFLDNIQGAVTLHGGTGSNTLTVDDQNDTFNGDTYTIGIGSIQRTAEALISYSGTFGSVTVNGGSANITYDINSTASGTPLTVNAGNGANTFVMTPASDFLDNILGAVTLNAGTGNNTLTVDDQNDTFNDTYTIGVGSIQRTAEALISYSGTFGSVTVNGSNIANITYDINTTAAVTPLTINAGSGANVLNLTPTSENLNNLAGAVTINAGSASTVNVDDQLNAVASTYTVTATNVSRSGFGGLTYAGLGTLVLNGGSAADTYNIQSTAAGSTVKVNGGVSSDTFNLGSGNSLNTVQGALTVNGGGGTNTLIANDSSSASGQSYTLSSTQLTRSGIAAITYASLSAINATGSGNDTLTLLTPVPTVATTFNGGSGINKLVGPNATTTWTVSGVNSGIVTSVTFSNFQNLTGGSGNDTFNVTTSTASLSGTLNGGAGANKISYATLGSSYLVTVTLTSNTTGSATAFSGGFSNIGSAAGSTDTSNTLTGPNLVNLWSISGNNAGKVNTFSYTGMPHLVGGTNVDTFTFSSTSGKELSIKGGGAPAHQGDWLNYAAFPSASTVTVNLATGSASNVNGGVAGAVTGIQNVLGSATGTNNLTGDSQGNILIGGSGLNTLVGGSGKSLLIGGSGSGSITGGSGTDILIAGTTTYNATTTAGQNALMAILAELQSADTFADKVYDIIHGTKVGDPPPHGSDINGSNKLTWGGVSATVKASTGAFTLSGDTSASSNPDWFFSASPSTVSDFNDDSLHDEHNNNAVGTF